jgi:uncharacterized protein (TIGR02996 family)
MDEQAGILKTIAECPDDITHRLVYADWLEDHGQAPPAQFIRAQCTLRQLLLDPEDLAHSSFSRSSPFGFPVGEARFPVAVEAMRLRPEVRLPLLAPFFALGRDLAEDDEEVEATLARRFSFWTYRGLVEDVEVYGGSTVGFFVHHADAIFDRVPLLRLLFSRAPSREAYFAHPFGGEDDRVAITSVRAFLRKQAVARLQILDLRWLHLGKGLVPALLRCTASFKPRRLLLDGNDLSETLVAQLRERFGDALVYAVEDDIPF